MDGVSHRGGKNTSGVDRVGNSMDHRGGMVDNRGGMVDNRGGMVDHRGSMVGGSSMNNRSMVGGSSMNNRCMVSGSSMHSRSSMNYRCMIGRSSMNSRSSIITGNSFIGDILDVPRVPVSAIVDHLSPAVRKSHPVGTRGGVSIPVLLLAKVSSTVVITDSILVSIEWGLSKVRGNIGGARGS